MISRSFTRQVAAGLAAGLLAVAPLLAQSNAERMANDRYTRSHDYDLVHQVIEVAGFNWDSTSFDGMVTTTLVALRPGLDSVILDAGHRLVIRSVTGPGRAALRFATHGDTLVVFPARRVAFHDTLTFSILYKGIVDNGRGLTFIQPEGRDHRPQQIWSQGEDHDNHYWFPTYDFPNDKMSWELTATVPRAYTAVSNGTLVSDTPAPGGQHSMRWREAKPSATYLVSLIVAPLVKIHDAWHGIPVDYYVYRADSARAWRLFHQTVDEIDTYSRLTGVPYPWAKYAQTTVADFFGGMENVSATTLIDALPDNRAYQDRPWFQWILIPHELAHQWFGDYVTTANWANTWLNEGFAEFMPGQYWLKKLGEHAADDYYLDEYRQFMQIDRRRRMPLAALGSNNIYPKGALVLRMLQQYLGPEPFWASLHNYLTTHALDVATTDDLRQAILEATGRNVDRFFDEWIYQAGYPEFAVSAVYDSSAHALTLTVRQTQADTLTKPDSSGFRYTTPLVFHMPVTVRVGTAKGDVTRTFALDAREQTLVVPGVGTAPTYVVFDDEDQILKTLDFTEPTAWLATQLKHDPDLWNRQWVIEQLARRSDDTLAAHAIAEAATGADYFLTRQVAAEVLASFPGEPTTMPALERALHDTSSQVRQAAVFAVGAVGGDHALDVLHNVLAHDSSYGVHTEAINALTDAKDPDLPSIIRAGLTTPSYQDGIQAAALRAIARSNDTTFIGAVDSLAPTAGQAMGVLAVLGNGGSTRALDVMAGYLNSDRAFLRRRAVQAFARVKTDVAVAKLEAVRDGLKYDDVKQMVDQTLKQLKSK